MQLAGKSKDRKIISQRRKKSKIKIPLQKGAIASDDSNPSVELLLQNQFRKTGRMFLRL